MEKINNYLTSAPRLSSSGVAVGLSVFFIPHPEWLDIQLYSDTNVLIHLSRNISLWPVIGAWDLLIWPFILILRLPRQRNNLAIAGAYNMGTMVIQ